MLSFESLYAHGYSQDQLERIQSFGFSLRPETSAYAGAQSLRFVDFQNPPALELIHVRDGREYSDFIPPGMTPYCPGISLVVDSDSPKVFEEYKAAWKTHEPYDLHFDYSGGKDPDKPGTNYLNFAIPLVGKTFIYLTQHQKPVPESPAPQNHPNAALRVSGLVFDLPGRELAALSALWGETRPDGVLSLGGLSIYTREQVPAWLREKKKTFPLVAVVAACGTPHAPPHREFRTVDWLGGEAVVAEMNPLSWDILFTR